MGGVGGTARQGQRQGAVVVGPVRVRTVVGGLGVGVAQGEGVPLLQSLNPLQGCGDVVYRRPIGREGIRSRSEAVFNGLVACGVGPQTCDGQLIGAVSGGLQGNLSAMLLQDTFKGFRAVGFSVMEVERELLHQQGPQLLFGQHLSIP